MTGASKTLESVPPREQIGAVTGRKYEYQYQRAATTCLELLESDAECCVFCEWHDDYVFESQSKTCALYAFYQVKTAPLSAPWSAALIFGIGRKCALEKQLEAREDCMAARLFEHVIKFGGSFQSATIVTNAATKREVTDLLAAVSDADSIAAVQVGATLCARICRAFALRFKVAEESVFRFLKQLVIESEVGNASNLEFNLYEIGHRIYELSEISLDQREVLAIGREIVDLVRRKSHATLPAPISHERLRIEKGILAADVLGLLSLSSEGYATLRASGDKAALQLSRLHRLCERSGVPSELVPEICRMKTRWDAWYLEHRHQLGPDDKTTLDTACHKLLTAHSAGSLPFERLASETENLASRITASFAESLSIGKTEMLGRVFALAAEKASAA